MLSLLRIQNLALVEELDWSPSGGFVALTGETGAGKSILIGALKLLLGERADKSAIRAGCSRGSVEAVFQLSDSREIDGLLESGGLDPCEEGALILRRSFSLTGPSRQFVNGCACPLALLKTLGGSLVDLHGPHDHQSLFSRDAQTRLLDAFAQTNDLREEFSDLRHRYLAVQRERETLAADEQTLRREAEVLQRQVQEIEDAHLQPEEEEPLLARFRAASNAQRLGELCGELCQRISDSEDAILSRLMETARLLKELARLDPRLESVVDDHAHMVEQLENIVRSITDCADTLESDPDSLRAMESRMDLLQSLKRKYGSTLDEVIAFGQEAADRLSKIGNREERLVVLEKEEAEALKKMREVAQRLSNTRKKSAVNLTKRVVVQLKDLGFAQAGFEIHFEEIDPPGPLGADLVEFLFAPNPGEPAAPLRSIASSGEISRVMLALKTELAAQDHIPLLVFDEIDANVGGEIAHRVADKMREIGKAHQIICITHLPQVAAVAKSHFAVRKVIREGRTFSELHKLEGTDRRTEIARMLGGKSDAAFKHADALLSSKPK